MNLYKVILKETGEEVKELDLTHCRTGMEENDEMELWVREHSQTGEIDDYSFEIIEPVELDEKESNLLYSDCVLSTFRILNDGGINITLTVNQMNDANLLKARSLHKTSGVFMYKSANGFTSKDIKLMESVKVDPSNTRKSESQRLRDVLHVLWSQQGNGYDWDQFYKMKMEGFINSIKELLD